MLTERYEQLRESVLARKTASGPRGGHAALTARGMATWIQLAREPIPPQRSPLLSPSWDATHVPQLLHDDLIQLMGEAVMTLVARESRYE